MTTYIVTSLHEDHTSAEVLGEEQAQERLADFFADDNLPDGQAIQIRKANYMDSGERHTFAELFGGPQRVQVNQFSQAGEHSVTVQAGGDVAFSRGDLTVIHGSATGRLTSRGSAFKVL